MKVALVIFRFIDGAGGVERYCARFGRMLLAQGHEVHIFSARREGFDGEDFVFHDVPVNGLWSPLTVRSFADNSAAMLQSEEFDVIHGFSRTYYQDIYRIGGGTHRSYLRRTKPWTTGLLGRAVLALNPRHRVIFDLERKRFAPGAYKRLVAISGVARQEVVDDYGVPPEDIAVIHNAVDADRFSENALAPLRGPARRELAVADGETLYFLLGTGWARKGLDFLVEAFSRIPLERGAKLLVVGKGPVARYNKLCAKFDVAQRVIFLGPAAPERYYAAADAFVFPTLHDGFGTVALEAMAAGLPVICSAKAGASEVIDDGVNGVVIPDPTDVLRLSEAMKSLLDSQWRQDLGEAARKKAGEYSFERNYRLNMEVYAQVVEEKRRART